MALGDRLGSLEVGAASRNGRGALMSIFDELVARFSPADLAARKMHEYMARAICQYDRYLGGTVYRGSGPPPPKLGYNGDIYFHIVRVSLGVFTVSLYGPKTDNGWGTAVPFGGTGTGVGSEGDVWTTLSGVGTWAPPAPAVIPSYWTTLYEPDLLGHSSFTYPTSTPDTSHVVDGVNLWAKNTVNGTISIGAAANQGIKIIQTSSTGAFFNGTPFVYIEFPDMATIGYGDGPIRVQVQYELVVGFTGVQFTNEIGIGIGTETGGPAAQSLCVVRKGAGSGTANLNTLGAYSVNGASNALETITAPVGSNDVATMLFYPPFSAEYAFSTYSSGYAAPATPLGKLFFWQNGSSGVPGFTMNKFGSTNVNGYQVVLGLNTGNGGAVKGTVYFKRLRVQQWVPPY